MTEQKIPETMKALLYSEPRKYSIQQIPVPKLRDTDILVKVKACGLCGTDLHIHEGEFIARFPVVLGHEVVVSLSTFVFDC